MGVKKKPGPKAKSAATKKSTIAKAKAKKSLAAAKTTAAKATGAKVKGGAKNNKIEGATALKSPRAIANKLEVASRSRKLAPLPSADTKSVASQKNPKKVTGKTRQDLPPSVAPTLVPVYKVARNVEKTRTNSDTIGVLSAATSLSRKEVRSVLDALNDLVELDLSKNGPGDFRLNNLVKITYVQKKATKSRKGKSPFTGELMTYKAKPARKYVKVRALKALKDLAP